MLLLLIDSSNQQFSKKSSHFISSVLTLIFRWPSVVSFPQFAHILILPMLKPCNYNESYWPTYTCSFGDCKELSVGPHRHILVCHVKQHLLILILEFKPNIFVLFGAANDTVVGSLQEKKRFYWKRNFALPNLEKTFPILRLKLNFQSWLFGPALKMLILHVSLSIYGMTQPQIQLL